MQTQEKLKVSDMGRIIRSTFLLPLLLLSSFCSEFGATLDIITSSKSIKDPEYIVSNGGVFRLGFFSPASSTYRYVGIWYNSIPGQTVVWVANRNKPLKDSSGVLTMSEDGNLVILNGQKDILWSSNLTNPVANSSAQLLDSGNFVLRINASGTSMWESFQHPSNVFMPTMKLSVDKRTGEKVQLTSWKSPSDPSDGNFLGGINPLKIPEVFTWNVTQPYWRSGPMSGQDVIGFPKMISAYVDGITVVDDQVTPYVTFALANASTLSYILLDSQGISTQRTWDDVKGNWVISYSFPRTDCDVYGKCGAFGSCDTKKPTICNCLRGFEPKSKEEWDSGNWTSGCVRSTPLQSEKVDNGSEVGKGDGFLKVEMMKVPAFPEWSSDLEDGCGDQCLNNRSCVAYAYVTGVGCTSWSGNLIDLQKFFIGGIDLYIRVASSELDKTNHVRTVILVTVILAVIIITISAFFFWRWMAKHIARKQKSKELVHGGKANTKLSIDLEHNFDEEAPAATTIQF